eukprot:6292781-Prymnesium_polylepis.1
MASRVRSAAAVRSRGPGLAAAAAREAGVGAAEHGFHSHGRRADAEPRGDIRGGRRGQRRRDGGGRRRWRVRRHQDARGNQQARRCNLEPHAFGRHAGGGGDV